MKTCKKCVIEKPYDEFYANNSSKDKKDSYCKECRKIIDWQYSQTNRERRHKYHLKWQKNNTEKIKELNKKNYQNNKEAISQKNKEYYQQNKEKYREYQKKWRLKNAEKYKAYQKEYREKNKNNNIENLQKRKRSDEVRD